MLRKKRKNHVALTPRAKRRRDQSLKMPTAETDALEQHDEKMADMLQQCDDDCDDDWSSSDWSSCDDPIDRAYANEVFNDDPERREHREYLQDPEDDGYFSSGDSDNSDDSLTVSLGRV